MRIRRISRQPCLVCGTDTMHNAMKCMNCGNVNESNTGARARAFKERVKRACAKGRGSSIVVGQILTQYHRDNVAFKRAERVAIPAAAKPGSTMARFGRGRERTRA